jgi:hypothetical protein
MIWQQAQQWLNKLRAKAPQSADAPDDNNPCCGQSLVHIAFRGKSDDRMYITYKRQWQEVRFYKPNGLRVFCAACRRRLL